MDCSCCINTYQRPDLLKKLLLCLINQTVPDNISYEIIVVENDLAKNSRYVIDEIKLNTKIPIKYFLQPEKNIALTRNKAIAEATGEYILFIDDDEYADKQWIYTSIECIKKYNADAVFGKVLSYFDTSTPDWIKNNQMFQRQTQISGTTPNYTRTGNCIIKAEILKLIPGPFDLEYGLTGGSDSHLFSLLFNKGAKFVYCDESVVYEYVPPERANLKWLLKRSMRTGNSYARRTIELSKHKIITKLYLGVKGLILLIIYFLFSFSIIFWRKFSIRSLINSSAYLGHILAVFNYYYEEYK